MNLLQKYEKQLKVLKMDDEEFSEKLNEIATAVFRHNNDKLSFEFCKKVYYLFGERNLTVVAFLINENSSFYGYKVIESIKQSERDKNIPPINDWYTHKGTAWVGS